MMHASSSTRRSESGEKFMDSDTDHIDLCGNRKHDNMSIIVFARRADLGVAGFGLTRHDEEFQTAL